VANDRGRGGNELELIRRLTADLDQPVRGIVATDLLRFRKIVEMLFDGKEVGKRAPSPPAARVGRDLDRLGFVGLPDLELRTLGFVEQAALFGWGLLAPRSEALGA